MQPAQAHLRSVASSDSVDTERVAVARPLEPPAPQGKPRHGLRPLQCVGGLLVFLGWLALFAAGIMVDTAPYRRAISPEGERLLRAEGQPPAEAGGSGTERSDPTKDAGGGREAATTNPPQKLPLPETPPPLVRSSLIVFFCFLPLNLAWLCVTSSTLGAVGNLANLSNDEDSRGPRDASNPLTSAILRGFFVYLFLMSGLLLLDHAPFSNAGPSQYIRLAGFLSLFSFVVSYHPHLFGALIVSAFQRIQVRAGDGGNGSATSSVEQHTSVRTVEIESRSAAVTPAPAPRPTEHE